MDHQDWKPLVFSKAKPNTSVHIQHEAGFKTKQNLNSDDPDAPKKLGSENGKKIQTARNGLKLTQKELAQKLNIRDNVIRDYEIGAVVPDKNVLNKISRFLKIKIDLE